MTGVLGALFVGIGATAVMDGWAVFQKLVFGVPSLDYRLVGRWIGHLPGGRFSHGDIAKTPMVRGEAALGWMAHYVIGIVFAAILVCLWPEWLRHPTLLPALIIGIGSIVAPFFILQPCLGAGIAASRTPQPWLSRLRSLLAHTLYAIGLFVSGVLFARYMPIS